MRISVKKEKVGWGKWAIIETHKCNKCNKEYRIKRNWTGPRPKGAILCPNCNEQQPL